MAIRRGAGMRGELRSEFFGTCVLIALGDGVNAMVVAALPGSGRTPGPTVGVHGAGDWLMITSGWAVAVAFAVWVAGGVSGAHLNPAATLAFAVRRGFAWAKVLPYWFAQVAGAFAGAALVNLVYYNAIDAYDIAAHTRKGLATFSIFATYPAPYFHGGNWGPLIDQVAGTALLLVCIVAATDARNTAIPPGLAPLATGLAAAAIGMAYGANAGYALNPARDLGPRLLAYLAGWGKVALPGTYDYGGVAVSDYFWIPIAGPLLGAIVGVVGYDLFIGRALHARLQARRTPTPTGDEEPQIPVS
jgi:glycerol uptake facilitator protein